MMQIAKSWLAAAALCGTALAVQAQTTVLR